MVCGIFFLQFPHLIMSFEISIWIIIFRSLFFLLLEMRSKCAEAISQWRKCWVSEYEQDRKCSQHYWSLAFCSGGLRMQSVRNPKLEQLSPLCTELCVCSFPYGHLSFVVFWESLHLFPQDVFIIFTPKWKLFCNKTWLGEVNFSSVFGKDILK